MLFADDIIQLGDWWWEREKRRRWTRYIIIIIMTGQMKVVCLLSDVQLGVGRLSLPLTTLLYLFCSCCCTATGKLCLLPVDVVGRSPWPNSQTTCLFNYSVLIECIQEKIKMQWRKINANNILFIVFIQCHQSPSSIGDVFTVSHSRMKLIQWPQDKVSGTL